RYPSARPGGGPRSGYCCLRTMVSLPFAASLRNCPDQAVAFRCVPRSPRHRQHRFLPAAAAAFQVSVRAEPRLLVIPCVGSPVECSPCNRDLSRLRRPVMVLPSITCDLSLPSLPPEVNAYDAAVLIAGPWSHIR